MCSPSVRFIIGIVVWICKWIWDLKVICAVGESGQNIANLRIKGFQVYIATRQWITIDFFFKVLYQHLCIYWHFFLTLSLWDELSSSLPGTSNDQTMTSPTKSSTQLLRRGRGSLSPWMGAVRGSTYSLSGYEMSKDVSRTRQKDSKCQPATWGHLAGIKDDFKNSQTIPDYLGMIVGDRTWFDWLGKAVKKKHRLGKVVKKKIRFFQYH